MPEAAESKKPRRPSADSELDAAREAVVADLPERVGRAQPRRRSRRAR